MGLASHPQYHMVVLAKVIPKIGNKHEEDPLRSWICYIDVKEIGFNNDEGDLDKRIVGAEVRKLIARQFTSRFHVSGEGGVSPARLQCRPGACRVPASCLLGDCPV